MPLSSVYNIETRYRVDAMNARRQVDSLADRMGRLSSRAEHTKSRLAGLFTGLAVGAGAVGLAGVGLATRHMFQLGMATESAKISIAGIFSTVGDKSKSFTQNLERAQTLFEKFGEASIESPFDRYDFVEVFGAAAPALASDQLGLNDDQITSMMSRAAMAGKVFNQGDMEQTGRDIVQMLQGNAGTDTKTFAAIRTELFDKMGVSGTEAFNKIAKNDPSQVFEAINDALKGLDPAIKTYGDSFEGLFSTIKEQLNIGVLHAWDAFTEEVQDDLAAVADYLKDHQGDIKAFASRAGKFLGDAFQKIGRMAVWAKDHIGELISALGLLAGYKSIKVGIDIAEIAKAGALGLSGGGGMIGKAVQGGSALLGGGKMASMVAGITTAGLALGGVAVASVALSEAFKILSSDTKDLSASEKASRDYWEASSSFFMGSLTDLGKSIGLVNDKTGNIQGVGEVVLGLGGVIAQAAGYILDSATALWSAFQLIIFGIGSAFEELLNMIGITQNSHNFVEAIAGVRQDLAPIYDRWFGNGKSAPNASPKNTAPAPWYAPQDKSIAQEEANRALKNTMGFYAPVTPGDAFGDWMGKGAKERADSTKKPENQGTPKVDITNNITQHIRTGADPDRIALRAADVIGEKIRHSIKPYAQGL